jgi:hypothetical protein
MSAIDICSHDGFFPFKEEDAYYPNWLHMGNQSGREEEYGIGSNSEEDVEDFQPVEDFSPLELAQHMQRKERHVPLRQCSLWESKNPK